MADIAKKDLDAENAFGATEVEKASSQTGDDVVVDEGEIKSVRRRVDWRLIPALGSMYGMSGLNPWTCFGH